MRRVLASLLLLMGTTAWGAEPTLKERAERVAAELPWYNVRDAMYDRRPHWGPNLEKVFDAVERLQPVAPPAATLPGEARGAAAKWKPEEIRPLLGHPDAKVRTLGLMLLYDLERVDVLPDIALLIKDQGATFPKPGPISAVLQPPPTNWPMEKATVAEYAREMIENYRELSDELSDLRPWTMEPEALAEKLKQFAARRDPTLCTPALRVSLQRATSGQSTVPDGRRVPFTFFLIRLEQVPIPRRFYVAAAMDLGRYQDGGYIGDSYMLSLARQVPRETRLVTISGDRGVDDPDLSPWSGARYLLTHAADLFREQDADLMIQLEAKYREKANTVEARSPAFNQADYSVAAATLRPAKADEILIDAMTHFGNDRPTIALGLARLGGERGITEALEWFFRHSPQPHTYGSDREVFLRVLHQQDEVRYRKLVEQIIRDPRLNTLGPVSTRVLIQTVSGYLGKQLANEEQIRQSYGIDEAQGDRKFEHLAVWQGLLRSTVDQWSK